MIKIALISTFAAGGAGTAAYRLHTSLMKREGMISHFVQRHDNKQYESSKNIVNLLPTRSLEFKLRRKFNLTPEILNEKRVSNCSPDYEIATFPITSYRIEDDLIVKDADIVHLHWVSSFVNYPTFFENIKQPIIWTLHDMNPFQGLFHYKNDQIENHNKLGKIDQEIYDLKIRSIHINKNISIVTPSGWMGRNSIESDTFSAYPHSVIPNSLDFSRYPMLDISNVKKELGVHNGLKTILFVAECINYRKGYDLLLESISQLENTQFNLISVGRGYLPCNDNVNHIHFEQIKDIWELNKIYAAADMLVLPSREDNLPNVMLECMANGTPVMSFSNGGMAEHIQTGVNGILLDEINVESLKDGITNFLNNKYIFNREVIRKYAEDNFSEDHQVDRYIELYNKVLNR